MSHQEKVVPLRDPERGACPGSEALAACFAGDSDARIRSHVESCHECRAILQALEPMRAFEHDLKHGLVVPPRARWFGALASAAILLVGCGLWLLLTEPGVDPASPHSRTARRSAEVVSAVAPAHQSILPAAPAAFVFENPDGARAQVLLYDHGLRPVWQSDPHQGDRIVVPQAARNALHEGETYLWKVTLSSGVNHQTSPLYAFTLGGE